MELGIILITILILVSGIVAYIGNQVGRSIGRRRLTVFGLRPRYTAHLIAVLTGMLITLITIGAVLLVSQDAQVGLFRLGELRQQIDSAESRLKELQGGDIAYLRNQEVLRELIDGRLPQAQILERLDRMRLQAVDLAVSNGIAPDLVSGAVLSLDPPNLTWEAIARLISLRRADTIVRIIAVENTLRGESLHIFVQLVDRKLAYRRGTVLFAATIDGQAGREQVGRELLGLADEAANRAAGKILSPPLARITELPRAQVDVDNHRAAIAEIAALRRPVRVEVVAARDITTDMSLAVTFVIKQ